MPEHTELEIDSVIARQNVAKEGWTTYYVDGTNGNDASNGFRWETAKKTIQAAVDAAESWATIYVKAGTYAEMVTIAKDNIQLLGEKKETTIINPLAGNPIEINSNKCIISGITAKTPGAAMAISVIGNHNVIVDCIGEGASIGGGGHFLDIHDCICHSGFQLSFSEYSEIYNCHVDGAGIGISLRAASHFNRVHDNEIMNCTTKGISVFIVAMQTPTNNSIYHNNMISNTIQVSDNGTNNKFFENYYDDHIVDTNNDGLCDTPYTFTTGTDYSPVSKRNGWLQESLGFCAGGASASGSGTLNTATANPHTATIVPTSLPTKMQLIFDISNLNTNLDDFEIQVSVGAAASERVIAWYGLTSDGADITCDTGSGVGSVIKQRRIDISNILVYTGEQVIVSLKRNAGVDDTVNFKYLCGV